MRQILAYTFRTFPYKANLSFANIRVFGKLNDDINDFCEEVLSTKPDRIVGFAQSTGKFSTLERYTVNRFSRNKKVFHAAPDRYELDIPIELARICRLRTTSTTSFCNLSMFKIRHFLQENDLEIPFAFVHVFRSDLKKFLEILTSTYYEFQ